MSKENEIAEPLKVERSTVTELVIAERLGMTIVNAHDLVSMEIAG